MPAIDVGGGVVGPESYRPLTVSNAFFVFTQLVIGKCAVRVGTWVIWIATNGCSIILDCAFICPNFEFTEPRLLYATAVCRVEPDGFVKVLKC